MSFQRDFNELLNEILTEYRNRFSGNITEGSVLYIKAACTASMLWGLYQTMDRVADQIFVGTATREFKERHAAEFGIVTAGKSDAAIVDEVLAAKRSKMSGGNKYDYAAWAREVTHADEHITHAMIVPLARGEGTFDIIVVGNKNRGVASAEICAKAYDLIQSRRPIGSGFSWGMRVCPAGTINCPITIAAIGANWDHRATKEAIMAYADSLLPREILYESHILSIMLQYGAIAPRVVSPGGNIRPPESAAGGQYNAIRIYEPNDITILED